MLATIENAMYAMHVESELTDQSLCATLDLSNGNSFQFGNKWSLGFLVAHYPITGLEVLNSKGVLHFEIKGFVKTDDLLLLVGRAEYFGEIQYLHEATDIGNLRGEVDRITESAYLGSKESLTMDEYRKMDEHFDKPDDGFLLPYLWLAQAEDADLDPIELNQKKFLKSHMDRIHRAIFE